MKRHLAITLAALSLAGCVHFAAEIATNRFPTGDPAAPEMQTVSVAEQNAAWCRRHDCAPPPAPVRVLMDTHAHLSMGPGMGPFFSGKPWAVEHEPHWSHRFSEKMAVEHLKASGLKLIVVSLYANVFAIWPTDPYSAIGEEIAQTHELVRRYPDLFTLTTTSEQARRAIADGKIALVMHLEGGEWIMRSQADVAALYRAGVRGANPAHLYESWIGGSDLQAGGRKILNPPGWANSHEVNGHRENNRGLTPEGKRLFITMRDYGMMIDFSHLSRKSIRDLHAMPELAGVPVFNSHMPDVAHTTNSERGVDDEAFAILRARHGLLGLVPTAHSPEILEIFGDQCPGSVETYTTIYNEAVRMANGVPVGFASDFNGGIGHLKPLYGPDGCHGPREGATEFQQKGLAHAGLIPAALEEMRARGADLNPMYEAAERFLQNWEQVEKLKRY